MLRLLDKLLNIRPSEWRRLLLLYAMAFLAITGTLWGTTIVEAAFLQQVGIAFLPWFFVARALAAIPAVALYSAFADQITNQKLLIGILLIGALGIIAGLALLGLGMVALAFPFLYLIAFVPLDDILAAHWYTYINGFYDTRSAKRVIPVLATTSATAGVVAGLTMPVLNRLSSPAFIIAIWLTTLLIMALLVWLMPYLLKNHAPASDMTEYGLPAPFPRGAAHPNTYLDNLREGYRYVSQSPLLRWMTISSLLLMVLLACIQYQASQIMLAELGSTEKIANFIGLVTGFANLLILPLQLFLFSRIIGMLGLKNANLIYPTGTLAICGGLIAAPGLSSAALAHFDRSHFYSSFGYLTESLLYNAVPLRVTGRARVFIGGLVVPLGSLLGGLLLATSIVSSSWLFHGLIVALAIGYLAAGLVIRKQYAQALISLLEQEDFSFLFSQGATNIIVSDAATLAVLKKKLAESTSDEAVIFSATLIGQIGGSEALPVLEQATRAAQNPHTRAALLDIIIAADLRGAAARQLYRDCLADPDPGVRLEALSGLEQVLGPDNEQFLTLALDLLADPDIEVCSQILPALIRSSHLRYRTPAIQVLNRLLEDPNPLRRAQAVRALGVTSDQQIIRRLLEYLADPADEVRLEVVVALEATMQAPLPLSIATLALNRLRPLVADPVERVRQAALVLLVRIGAREAHQFLMHALTDPSPQVRTTAIDALVRIGKTAIPTVYPALNAADPQLRKMATVMLSRIDPAEFGALVQAHMIGNVLAIYRNQGRLAAIAGYESYAGMAVLQSVLDEQCQQLVEESVFLLASAHNPRTVQLIIESLRSDIPRVRANAAETLESLTTPQTARLITPLFDPDLDRAALLEISRDVWEMQPPDCAGTLKDMLADPADPWLRAIVVFALGEIGAALLNDTPVQTKVLQAPSSARLAGDAPGADLISLLGDAPLRNATPVDVRTPPSVPAPLTLPEIMELLQSMHDAPEAEVHMAVRAAERLLAGFQLNDLVVQKDAMMLSTIEKIIFLKEVPFFQGMTIDQLKVLATVCEEGLFPANTRIFSQGDLGGVLYVVVNGRVGIEHEKREGAFARLATIEAHSYFGEMNLFDNSPRSASAIALQDTLTLCLRREPLIALIRQHPNLSLELINVLSQRLREANDRIADLTHTKPRKLQRLYDTYE